MNSKGLVYMFTGKGKGKTSAALGVVVRALGVGMKVGWISWFKEEKWQMSELNLKGKIEMYMLGEGFYKLPGDKVTEKEHKQAAKKALKKAGELIKRVEVLVLDEVCKAVEDGLVEVGEVASLINQREKTHVILTGRGKIKELVEAADLVTEMKKIKHPFDKGIKAIKGLDY